jgi:DNA invertase Pin-like site-specific DNA recombinase
MSDLCHGPITGLAPAIDFHNIRKSINELVRQRIGIEAAKQADKSKPQAERSYKGAKPTAREKAASVHTLLAAGHTKEKIAKDLKIGIASAYRILKTAAYRA